MKTTWTPQMKHFITVDQLDKKVKLAACTCGEPLDTSMVGISMYHIDLLVLYAALTEHLNKQVEEAC